MPRSDTKTVYVCSECETRFPRWEGRCSRCGAWNALNEFFEPRNRPGSNGGAIGSRISDPISMVEPIELSRVEANTSKRLGTGIGEFDRVLGGGAVAGSVLLLSGDPGVGKSTLLLQTAGSVAARQGSVLYVSGEESADQVRMRAGRLGVSGDRIFLLNTDDVDAVVARIDILKPGLVVVDSIQTVTAPDVPGAAGSVNQVRECARRLTARSKMSGIPLILAGHVTKDGSIAGPRVLEHMVDVVLQLSGDGPGNLRTLHGIKNRYGHTNEVGVFEMGTKGLLEVSDPSRSLLTDRSTRPEPAPGTAVAAVIEGTRPLIVEVQALTAPSGGQTARRVATGIDLARMNQVVAVLARRVGLPLASQDVIVSVTGGMRLTEPAADLPVAIAIASSLLDVAVDVGLAAAGEIGLSGELRAVPQADRRRSEADRLGFRGCILPVNAGGESYGSPEDDRSGVRVGTLGEAVRAALPRQRDGLHYAESRVAAEPGA
ncbi:MAG: DNA repair protein RadA [Dehalococcoidia bacterium]|nr:DNA repair protein RadA [Dehalococcoidia bacterium]